MNKPNPTSTSNAFDDLLDGDTSTPDALRKVADSAQADREEARESMKRAAAHVRQRGEHAARAAHEKAHAIGASVRRHVPSVTARVRQEMAVPIRWRVVGPILAGSTVLAGGVLAALLAWNAHRYSNPNESEATAVKSAAEALAPAAGSPVAAPAVVAGAPAVVPVPTPVALPAGNFAPVAVVAPSIPAPSSDPAETSPMSPALPPAPTEPTVQNCTAAVPLLNSLFASAAHARTPEEIAWAAFGYRCAQNGALSYSNVGYAAKSAEQPSEKPRSVDSKAASDEPVRAAARAPKPPVRAAKAHAPVVASVPQAPVPMSALSTTPASAPGTCVLRGTASTTEGIPMPNAPVEITGLDGSHFKQQVSADTAGRFTASVPSGARVRTVLRARGYLDDVRETLNCAPVVLTGKKSNPFSSIFDAARRADRSIKGATGGR